MSVTAEVGRFVGDSVNAAPNSMLNVTAEVGRFVSPNVLSKSILGNTSVLGEAGAHTPYLQVSDAVWARICAVLEQCCDAFVREWY